jgi:hypothetical protein
MEINNFRHCAMGPRNIFAYELPADDITWGV